MNVADCCVFQPVSDIPPGLGLECPFFIFYLQLGGELRTVQLAGGIAFFNPHNLNLDPAYSYFRSPEVWSFLWEPRGARLPQKWLWFTQAGTAVKDV
ncbi:MULTISPECIES: hypothetical protein [unclassified Leptolyngbya]|uniref:hypothetical protein n=1 Tax=unclassified Leptolyngbya TaxID=2650499 RepID=UPI001681CC4E|nr:MULTISPECIES: hypothetical protein [unclassified Leptolyngbya]MBD1913920.1 hypothetical protein [Leptolyngbya sp. FACHB-8]MBD2156372.1 hypothetical protein [Leptolyngbya sp. FACHB-16]